MLVKYLHLQIILGLGLLVVPCLSVHAQVVDREAANLKAVESKLRQQLADAKPENEATLLYNLGTVLYRQGKVLEARSAWEQASSKDPNLAGPDVSAAWEMFGKGDQRAAELALRNALSKNAQDPHVYIVAGEFEMKRFQFQLALQNFRKAVELNPKLMISHIWLGKLYMAIGKPDEAKRSFDVAAELAPKRREPYDNLAELAFRIHKLDECLANFERMQGLQSDVPLPELGVANLYVEVKDYWGALHWYQKAHEKYPDKPAIVAVIARMMLQLKMFDQAREQLYSLYSLNPDKLDFLVDVAELDRQADRFDQAEKLYRHGLEIDPNNVAVNHGLALTLLSRGDADADEVLKLAKTAYLAAPKLLSVRATYGVALLGKNKADEALAMLQPLIRVAPSIVWIRYGLGKAYYQKKQFEQARFHLEGVLVLDPKFPRKSEIEQMIEATNKQAAP